VFIAYNFVITRHAALTSAQSIAGPLGLEDLTAKQNHHPYPIVSYEQFFVAMLQKRRRIHWSTCPSWQQ
jgi:hypothetical protein